MFFRSRDGDGRAVGRTSLDLGFAMIFVFYAYSGWNEIAYVSAEVRHPQKNILRALMLGTLAVSVLYIAVNLAFVHALGLAGLQHSNAVAADVTQLGVGPWAANCISLLICITALGGINGMIFTGARILYAMGTEHRLYSWLGQWNAKTDAPALPLMIQAAVSVALTIGFGWNPRTAGIRGLDSIYVAGVLALSVPGGPCAVRLAGTAIRSRADLPRAVLPARAVVVLSFQLRTCSTRVSTTRSYRPVGACWHRPSCWESAPC